MDLQLNSDTPFIKIKKVQSIIVFHVSSQSNLFKSLKSDPMHVGSVIQALDRAYLHIVDNADYTEMYMYKIVLNVGRLYGQLVIDSGQNAATEMENSYKKRGYDTLVYKNRGEGCINRNNLSLVVLNPASNILNIVLHGTLDENSELMFKTQSWIKNMC